MSSLSIEGYLTWRDLTGQSNPRLTKRRRERREVKCAGLRD